MTSSAKRARSGASAKPGYQPDDASPKIGAAGFLSVLALATLAALVVFGLYGWFQSRSVRAPTTALERAELAPAGPRLESDPLKDRLALEATARTRIESYGWADRRNGIARIPIERAMALQAAMGWPDAEASKP
ncbi:MAG TPA: hypothetical protein VLI41_08715 [Phenylobacterium sp.]|uniref:hypothetical protein n=1 Tax=Phenylobacterium sp. TaxID=1871053 RepID=UPI002C2B6C40|nr:hypothetical protein [Phenylobacterium sp.]HSV03275.1 hypothetical protein [Phenylobacterium sp.]